MRSHNDGYIARTMGRQWLQAKREVAGLKKGQMVGKIVKEIMVAAKLGGPEPEGNARLFAIAQKKIACKTNRAAPGLL